MKWTPSKEYCGGDVVKGIRELSGTERFVAWLRNPFHKPPRTKEERYVAQPVSPFDQEYTEGTTLRVKLPK